MKIWANRWWYALLTIVLYAIGDLATSVANFASNLKETATLADLSLKDWLTFSGGTVASLVLTLRGLMSTAWSKAKEGS